MSTNQQAVASNATKEPVLDCSDLKVRVPTAIKLRLKGLAAGSGQLLSTTTTEILEKGLAIPLGDEQVLGRILRQRLPHPLYGAIDTSRSSARTSWIEVVQGALAKEYLTPAPLPRSVPVVPRATPRVRESGIPGCSVTDDGCLEQDSGVRKAVGT
jgi:hypothetical protein